MTVKRTTISALLLVGAAIPMFGISPMTAWAGDDGKGKPAAGGQADPALPPPGSSAQEVRSYLGVTDAQETKIKAIKKKYDDKVNAVYLQIGQLQPSAEKEVEALLTPEQRQKKKAIEEKYKQKYASLQKQVGDLQTQGNDEIDAVFSPDQRKKIQALRQQSAALQQQQQQMMQQQQQQQQAPAPAPSSASSK